jgi:hypothetical protein
MDPLVGAGERVPLAPILRILPVARKDVLATTKQGAEQCHLGGSRLGDAVSGRLFAYGRRECANATMRLDSLLLEPGKSRAFLGPLVLAILIVSHDARDGGDDALRYLRPFIDG